MRPFIGEILFGVFILIAFVLMRTLRIKEERSLAQEAWENAATAVRKWVHDNPETHIAEEGVGNALLDAAYDAARTCVKLGIFKSMEPHKKLAQWASDEFEIRYAQKYIRYLDELEL